MVSNGFATKIVVAVSQSGDFLTLWKNGELPVTFWLNNLPKEPGIWIKALDEEGSWRRPTNKEWGKIVFNESPLEVDDERVDLREWVADKQVGRGVSEQPEGSV